MTLKVLVVDDAKLVRDMVKRTLRQMYDHVDFAEAHDGTRAMALIKQKIPDIILSDWEMPQMGGDELLRWVREQPTTKETPFIMITSRGDRDHVVEALKSGVTDYISKPFKPEELTRKVAKQTKKLGITANSSVMSDPSNRGVAFASVDVLTKGSEQVKDAAKSKAPSPKAAPKPNGSAASARIQNFPGTVTLRFADHSHPCEMMDLSLQALNGVIPRTEVLPQVFDTLSVDLEIPSSQMVARINAYVHCVAAAKASADSESVKVIVRFIDQDPAKLEVLSTIISKGK